MMDGKHADGESAERIVEKSDGRFSKAMVISCVIAWVGYLALYSVFKFLNPNGTWDSSVTVAWFAAWGTEIVMLASIKKSRIKNTKERD